MRLVLRIAAALGLVAAAVTAQPVNMVSTDLVVPGAGRGAGADGSFWTTDLWLRSAGTGQVTLEFHAMDSPSAAATAAATIPMAQPVVFLPDLLQGLFGLESAVGNIRVISGSPVSATIRVSSPSGCGGSSGFAFMGMPSSMSMTSFSGMMGDDADMHRWILAGLLPEPQARVNPMIVNTGSLPIAGTVEVLDADGGDPATGPLSFRFSIAPYSSHQILDALAGVHSRFAGDMGLQLRITLDDGTPGMMMALATVIDNVSNDSYVVMGSMMDSAMMGGGPGTGMP